MIETIKSWSQQLRYWVFLIASGISLEAAALYYQYVLDEWPCVLCIHVRIWILGFIVLAAMRLLSGQNPWVIRGFHLVNTGVMLGFTERSWQVLAVERGWVFGNCDMSSGLPAWFALDKWFPAVFEVQTACGYTPIIIANITMAETLITIAVLLSVASLTLLIASLLPAENHY